MRCKLMILSFVAVIGLCLSLLPSPADGDCSSGINKNHLDTTAGAFVDDTTIEIDDANGLQVKAIPGGSVSSAKIDSIFGQRTSLDTNSETLDKDTTYQAQCDGILYAYDTTGSASYGAIFLLASSTKNLVDSESTSVLVGTDTKGYFSGGGFAQAVVKKGEYCRAADDSAAGIEAIYWLPIGAGGLVDQTP